MEDNNLEQISTDHPLDPFPHLPDSLDIKEAAENVFRIMGSGHTESVYESALEIELGFKGFQEVRRQVPCPLEYRGYIVGIGYIDVLIENRYVVELKTVAKLTNKDEAQLKKYLRGLQTGILLNFNPSTGEVEVIKVL